MQYTLSREKHSQLGVEGVGRLDMSYGAVQIRQCGLKGQKCSM